MKNRALIFSVSLFLFCFVFVSLASAADWYMCRVVQFNPRADGEIRVVLAPAANETAFTENVRVFIDTVNNPGGKTLAATLLTAISMGSDVNILTDAVPTWTPITEATGVALLVTP